MAELKMGILAIWMHNIDTYDMSNCQSFSILFCLWAYFNIKRVKETSCPQCVHQNSCLLMHFYVDEPKWVTQSSCMLV